MKEIKKDMIDGILVLIAALTIISGAVGLLKTIYELNDNVNNLLSENKALKERVLTLQTQCDENSRYLHLSGLVIKHAAEMSKSFRESDDYIRYRYDSKN